MQAALATSQEVADIATADVVTTGGTQSRVSLSESAVAEYADAMQQGATLPPIVVFHDGSTYWLADGFHRVMAATRSGVEWLSAEIKRGTKRDAILYSVGANAAHGLPRTNADKRRAVTMLLEDEEWAQWADREIARRCAVSHQTVANVRESLSKVDSEPPAKTYTTKHGTVATMNTANIGRGQTGTKEAKTETIRELAEQGYKADQIASHVELTAATVRVYAKDAGIELPDRAIGKVRKIDNRRVIEQTVLGLEASAQAVSAVPVSFDGIDPDEASEWAEAVAEALRIFRRFHKQLQEVSNG